MVRIIRDHIQCRIPAVGFVNRAKHGSHRETLKITKKILCSGEWMFAISLIIRAWVTAGGLRSILALR